MKLLIATGNPHKVEEFGELFAGVPLTSLADFAPAPEPVEDAPDFAGNAIIKAKAAHAHTGVVSLADDSGIEVEALGWAPGVHSARYVEGSDDDRVQALLAAMAGQTRRRARFTCVIAVAGLPADVALPPDASWRDGCVLVRGEVYGVVNHGPRGENGFGYDPIFELPSGHTTAELSAEAKHAISHRGVAARRIAPLIQAFFLDQGKPDH